MTGHGKEVSKGVQAQLPSSDAIAFRTRVDSAIWMNQWGKVLEVLKQARGRPEWGAILGVDGAFGEGSPLLSAVEERQSTIVSAMIKAGADPDSRDKFGRTMLSNAIASRNIAMAECLLQHGADIDAGGQFCAPLGDVLAKDHAEEAMFLIDAGASQLLPESPLEIAVGRGALHVLRALLSREDLAAPACGDKFDEILKCCRSDEVRAELFAWRSEREVQMSMGAACEEDAPDAVRREDSGAL